MQLENLIEIVIGWSARLCTCHTSALLTVFSTPSRRRPPPRTGARSGTSHPPTRSLYLLLCFQIRGVCCEGREDKTSARQTEAGCVLAETRKKNVKCKNSGGARACVCVCACLLCWRQAGSRLNSRTRGAGFEIQTSCF